MGKHLTAPTKALMSPAQIPPQGTPPAPSQHYLSHQEPRVHVDLQVNEDLLQTVTVRTCVKTQQKEIHPLP